MPRIAIPVSYSYESSNPGPAFDLQFAAAEPRAVTADIVKHPIVQTLPLVYEVGGEPTTTDETKNVEKTAAAAELPKENPEKSTEKVLMEPRAFSFNVPAFSKPEDKQTVKEEPAVATPKRKRQSRRPGRAQSLQSSPIVVLAIEENDGKANGEQPQAANSEHHEHLARKDEKPAESKVQEQQAANSDHHHHHDKKEHHHKHEHGGGKKHDHEHHGVDGKKGHKKYEGHHEYDKKEHGKHDKEGHKGHYTDEGGHKKKHHEDHDHYGEHHEGEEGKKGAQVILCNTMEQFIIIIILLVKKGRFTHFVETWNFVRSCKTAFWTRFW